MGRDLLDVINTPGYVTLIEGGPRNWKDIACAGFMRKEGKVHLYIIC
jgi:hypothetical protein